MSVCDDGAYQCWVSVRVEGDSCRCVSVRVEGEYWVSVRVEGDSCSCVSVCGGG